jgi:hypothetical protein
MVDELTRLICRAINAEFNADNRKYAIYNGTVEQGFKEPSFSVLCLQDLIGIKGIRTYKNSYQYAIHYYSNAKDAYNDCLVIYERLSECLKHVKIAHCFDFSNSINDGVLTVTCTYTLHLIGEKDEQSETMEDKPKVTYEIR